MNSFSTEVTGLQKDWLQSNTDTVNRLLLEEQYSSEPSLQEAFLYSVRGPAKRLRPLLVLAWSQACRAPDPETTTTVTNTTQDTTQDTAAYNAAIAVELLHSYTLVHDDLPAMDNDSVRRGRPSVHAQFGVATAILVGDGLQTAAFARLATMGQHATESIQILSRCSQQLISGQYLDIKSGEMETAWQQLEKIHYGKTAALFAAAAELGAICGGATKEKRQAAVDFGTNFGLAFQYIDDVQDGDFSHLREKYVEGMTRCVVECKRLADGTLLQGFAEWLHTKVKSCSL